MYFWILLGVLAVILFYKYAYKPTTYWKDRGVPHLKAFPLFGSMASNFFRRLPLPDLLVIMYNKFPKAKYIGLFQFSQPLIMLRDPEIIKLITVKEFDSFMNHQMILAEDSDVLFGKNLLSLKGQKWKDMRSTLSPSFTGSKMRTMFALINDCANQFVQYFLKKAKHENGVVTIEMKDIFTRYANDVIATTAFGIECDSLTNQDNDFYMIGKKSTNFNGFALFKIIGFMIFPKLMKLFGVSFIAKEVNSFFRNIISSTLRLREKEGIVRPDMIHLLMEARKDRLKLELTDDDIIAQAFLFFFAGYDTTSTMMGFMAYELAVNPEIQKKLQEEIDKVVINESVNYDSILKMKYLDMIVSETLRKWPPAVIVERQCEKPFLIEDTNGNEPPVLIEKDITVWVPVYPIHHDPKYFPEPEKFDPERFNDENKDNILPFTYLPFGAGPRNCIGSRFALLEIKTLFVHFLTKFEFTVVEKTQIPLKFGRNMFNLSTEKGIWLGLKLRNK